MFNSSTPLQDLLNKLVAETTLVSEGSSTIPSLSNIIVSDLSSVLLPPGSEALNLLPTAEAAALLVSLARLRAGSSLPQSWLDAVLQGPLSPSRSESPVGCLPTRTLAEVAWAVSELSDTSTTSGGGPGSVASAWATGLLAAVVPRLPDFYGPDLSGMVCACGTLVKQPLLWSSSQTAAAETDEAAARPIPAAVMVAAATAADVGSRVTSSGPPGAAPLPPAPAAEVAPWRSAVAAESTYQLSEFTADFGPFDIAQLAVGLADLEVPVDGALRQALMKAVYR